MWRGPRYQAVMRCRAPIERSGRPRPGTVPARPRRTPPRAQCPAQATTTALGAAAPARPPASAAQTSPARYAEGAASPSRGASELSGGVADRLVEDRQSERKLVLGGGQWWGDP